MATAKTSVAPGGSVAPAAKGKPQKKKVKKNVATGIAHIQSTFNNTVVTITDVNGNTVAWSSAGSRGFKGSRKSTPFSSLPKKPHAARWSTGCDRSPSSSKARAPAAKARFVHFRPAASRSRSFVTSRRFRTTAAVRRSAAASKNRRAHRRSVKSPPACFLRADRSASSTAHRHST